MIVKLTDLGANQAQVSIGNVNMYFSYRECIAFNVEGVERVYNPAFRKYSVTTSKHASQMGVKDYPDAANAQTFALRLSAALAEAGQ